MLFVFLCLVKIYTLESILNINEVKLFDTNIENIEQYDQMQNKFTSSIAGVFENDVNIVYVTSQFSPFSSSQRVDVLTSDTKQNFQVYTITYDKFLLTNYNVINTVLENVNNCTSIAYLQNQFVADCNGTNPFFLLQNGTQIKYDNIYQFDYIQSYFEGIVGVSQNQLTIFSDSLQIENIYKDTFIKIIINQQNIFLLKEQYILYIDQDESNFKILHQCKQAPTTFAVIDFFIYVQCENLRIISFYESNKIYLVEDITAQSLDSTNNYLIVNNTVIFNMVINAELYYSSLQLYPINFNNQIITFNGREIIIGNIFGLSVISSNVSIQYQLNQDVIEIIDYGFVKLNLSNLENKESYQVYDYVAGPLITTNCEPPINITYNLDSSFQDKVIKTAFISNSDSIPVLVYVYIYNYNLYSLECQIDYAQTIIPKCATPTKIQDQVNPNIKNVQGIFNSYTNDIIYCYQQLDTIQVFVNKEKPISFTNIIDYKINNFLLVLLGKSNVTVYFLDPGVYTLETVFNISAKLVCLKEFDIYLVTKDNTVLYIPESLNGWYVSYEINFNENIEQIFINSGQLVIITTQNIYFYMDGIQRGNLSQQIEGSKQYISTVYNFYIYNDTQIYHYSSNYRISLSSLLQKVYQQNNTQQFFALTYSQDWELLLLDNYLKLIPQLQYFVPNTIVSFDAYTKYITANVTFYSGNQSIDATITTVGDQLQLSSKIESFSPQFDSNMTQEINLNSYFTGPISDLKLNGNEDDLILLQRINKLDEVSSILNEVKDTLYLGEQQTLVLTNASLLHCNNTNCSTIIYETSMCTQLQQDDQYYYLICLISFYQGSKQNLHEVTHNQFFHLLETRKILFSNDLIAIYDLNDEISIYKNLSLISNNKTTNLQDFCFNHSTLVLLTETQLIQVNTNFEVLQQFNLLQDLINLESQALEQTKFTWIDGSDDVYFIGTTTFPVYTLKITSNNIEIMGKITNIPNAELISVQLINPNCFVGIYQIENKYIGAFYDLTYNILSPFIVPYFQAIVIGFPPITDKFIMEFSNDTLLAYNEEQELVQYSVQKNITLQCTKQNYNGGVTLVASDFNTQKAIIELMQTQTDSQDDETDSLMIALYVLIGILGLIALVIIYHYVRKFCLTKKIAFVEEKPSEFKSEYI